MYARKEAEGIDWGKQWSNAISPFTNLGTDAQGNTNYNYLGTALLGGGTGLITWALARLLGLRSGASLTAGLLGAFATAYYTLGRQKYGENFNLFDAEQGKGIFGNIGDQVKNNLEQKKANKAIEQQTPTVPTPTVPVPTVPKPTVQPPSVPKPTVQIPTVPTPAVQPPAVPAPVPVQTQTPDVPGNESYKNIINPDPRSRLDAIRQAARQSASSTTQTPTMPDNEENSNPQQQEGYSLPGTYDYKKVMMGAYGNENSIPEHILTAPDKKLRSMMKKQDANGLMAARALKRRNDYNKQAYKNEDLDYVGFDKKVVFNPRYHPVNDNGKYAATSFNKIDQNQWTPEERRRIFSHGAGETTRAINNGVPFAFPYALSAGFADSGFSDWPAMKKLFGGGPQGWDKMFGDPITRVIKRTILK